MCHYSNSIDPLILVGSILLIIIVIIVLISLISLITIIIIIIIIIIDIINNNNLSNNNSSIGSLCSSNPCSGGNEILLLGIRICLELWRLDF